MSLPIRIVRQADAFESAQRELDQLLGRFFTQGAHGPVLAPYAVDVSETADSITVEAELPGFTKEQVDITLENSVLTISAERNESAKNGGENGNGYLLKERRYSRFQRSFTLPPTVDESSVSAKLDNGVLTVSVGKRQEAKPRKIAVG